MKMYVYYDNEKVTFEGDDPIKLMEKARKHRLYKGSSEIIFELEEVNEDGDKRS